MFDREYREVTTASGGHAMAWEKPAQSPAASDPFKVVRDFERALCEYTGAPYAVTTTSCTDALKLAVAYWKQHDRNVAFHREELGPWLATPYVIEIPKRTYVGVPMAIIHAGGRPTFRDEDWVGVYRLEPLPIWDSARWLTGGHYRMVCERLAGAVGQIVCLSLHWSKTLGVQQGGVILHDNPEADRWLRMARFDGRQEGVHPKDQKEWIVGHHCYMAPETAAAGLVRLRNLPRHNEPLPWGPGTDSDYPDLSTFPIFK